MKRAVKFAITLAVLVAIAITFSVVWAVLLVLAAITIGISQWKGLPGTAKTLAVTVLALAIVGVIWYMGAAPSHYDPGSAAASRLPGVTRLAGGVPEDHAAADRDPPFDELAQARNAFQGDVFKLRSQANAVDQVLSLRAATDDVVRFRQGLNLELSGLLDAKKAVDDALQRSELTTIEQLKAKQLALETFLKDAERAMKLKRTASEARDYLTQFRLQTIARALEDVSDRKTNLESVLNSYSKQTIDSDMHLTVVQTARLNETANELEREQVVSLSVGRLGVKEIDASELLLDHDPGEIRYDLRVAYGDSISEARQPENPRTIFVRPGVKKITLIRTSVIPAGLKDLPTGLRVWPFRYFLVKWLPLAPIKLRTVLDLSAAKGPASAPYVFEVPSDAPVESIRLPANSFYAASFGFKAPRREGSEDVLEPDRELKPSEFAVRSHIWIELMPDSIVFRNAVVQGKKEYFFPENAVAAITVVVLGAIWAAAI